MLFPTVTDDLVSRAEENRFDRADNDTLRAEIGRLRCLLAKAEERLNERTIDAAKAEHEARRQQARVENAMCWAEERRMEFLQVCAERDTLQAEVKSLQSQPVVRR